MNARGLVLIIAGIWVTAQVFGGRALERLKLVESDSPVAGTASKDALRPSTGSHGKAAIAGAALGPFGAAVGSLVEAGRAIR
jgi:hypothetical protein